MEKAPIRVLCVFSSLDRGGAESMCMNLYRNIDREKVQFDFVKHIKTECTFEREIQSLGGKIYTAPQYKVINHFEYCKWWGDFYREHPEYHIIHAHTSTFADIYLKEAKKAGRTTISHSHSSGVRGSGLVALYKKYMSLKAGNHADIRFACSLVAGKWMYGDKEFMQLNNAIDASRFIFNSMIREQVKNEFSIKEAFVLGTVGSLMKVKNPYGILDIFRLVHERRLDSKFLWVGDGPMRPEVQAKAEAYGLQDDVIFTGVRSDVERLLQAMDAFVFPSLYEGLGIAAVEAQAAGVPTYCSSEVPQEAGVTDLCHFLPLDDLNAWADAIVQLPAGKVHPDTYDQIVKAGYDIHETAKWLEDFYISILPKKD